LVTGKYTILTGKIYDSKNNGGIDQEKNGRNKN